MPTALLTGCNRGIGLELAKQLKVKGYELIAIVRNISDELRDISPKWVFENVDVTDNEALQKIAVELNGENIDLLINNAGVLRRTPLEEIDPDLILDQFRVNALAPVMVTKAFLPNLSSSSKVVMITSRMGSIEDNTSGGSYGYRMSKAALNAASKSLSLDLREKGVPVGIIHPGWVQTEMTGKTGHLQPEEAAENIIQRVDELNLENSGRFLHSNGEILPW